MTVARRVAPGREAEFEEWSAALTAARRACRASSAPGMLRPGHVGEPWHVVFRFESAAAPARRGRPRPSGPRLLAAGEELVHATDMHRVTGLETWFALPGRTAPAPPRWKMFVVSLAGDLHPADCCSTSRCSRCGLAVAAAGRRSSRSAVTALMTWL